MKEGCIVYELKKRKNSLKFLWINTKDSIFDDFNPILQFLMLCISCWVIAKRKQIENLLSILQTKTKNYIYTQNSWTNICATNQNIDQNQSIILDLHHYQNSGCVCLPSNWTYVKIVNCSWERRNKHSIDPMNCSKCMTLVWSACIPILYPHGISHWMTSPLVA